MNIDRLVNASAIETCTVDYLRIGPLTRVEQINLGGPVVLGAHCVARRSTIGRYTVAGDYCRFTDCDVGAFCSFGDNVLLNAGTHPKDWFSTSLFACNPTFWDWASEYRDAKRDGYPSFQWRKSNKVGNDVWIGANVVILSGVDIGDGAIIGANSVVTCNVMPYSVVAGAPARPRSKRFDDQTISALIDLHWWTLPVEKLLSLPFGDVRATLRALNSLQPDDDVFPTHVRSVD